MTPQRRAGLLLLGGSCLLLSWLLPAATLAGQTVSGLDLAVRFLLQRPLSALASGANLIVPLLALMPPRWPRVEVLVVTLVLAISAWLTARALVGPAQLHSGVWLWWVAMACLGVAALEARRIRQ